MYIERVEHGATGVADVVLHQLFSARAIGVGNRIGDRLVFSSRNLGVGRVHETVIVETIDGQDQLP